MLSLSQSVIQLTKRCTLRCMGCSLWQNDTYADLSDTLHTLLKKGAWSMMYPKTSIIHLIGGDPFQAYDAAKLLKSIKEQAPQTRLYTWTHGQLDPDQLEPCLKWIDGIVLFLPSADPKTYKHHTGEPDFERLTTTIALLKQKGIPFYFNHPILPQTVHELPMIHEFARTHQRPLVLHYNPKDDFYADSIAHITRFRWINHVYLFKRHPLPTQWCQTFPYGGLDKPLPVLENMFFEVLNGIRTTFGL